MQMFTKLALPPPPLPPTAAAPPPPPPPPSLPTRLKINGKSANAAFCARNYDRKSARRSSGDERRRTRRSINTRHYTSRSLEGAQQQRASKCRKSNSCSSNLFIFPIQAGARVEARIKRCSIVVGWRERQIIRRILERIQVPSRSSRRWQASTSCRAYARARPKVARRGARTRLRYIRTHGLFDLDVSELALYINKYSVLYRQRGSAAAAAAIEKDVLSSFFNSFSILCRWLRRSTAACEVSAQTAAEKWERLGIANRQWQLVPHSCAHNGKRTPPHLRARVRHHQLGQGAAPGLRRCSRIPMPEHLTEVMGALQRYGAVHLYAQEKSSPFFKAGTAHPFEERCQSIITTEAKNEAHGRVPNTLQHSGEVLRQLEVHQATIVHQWQHQASKETLANVDCITLCAPLQQQQQPHSINVELQRSGSNSESVHVHTCETMLVPAAAAVAPRINSKQSGRCFPDDSCPDDSTTDSKGQCVCIPHCPKAQPCEDRQHSLMVKPGDPNQPGKCCPLFECRAQELVRYEFGPTTGKLLDNCVDRSGNHHNFNDEWIDSMDPCMQCRCLDGKESCVIPHCKPCNRRLPPRKDQCCGDCVDRPIDCQVAPPLDCELRCETFDVNEQGCQICQCFDNVSHNNSSNKEQQQTTNTIDAASAEPTALDAETPAKSSVGANCTKLNCLQANTVCPYGNVLDSNGCPTCSCRLECPRLDSCPKKCPQGYRRDDKGCQICKCRSNCQDPDSRQIYKPDETWSPDPCRKCVCRQNGHISCSDTTECINYCENPIPASNGSCCPICPPKTTMKYCEKLKRRRRHFKNEKP
ncbi:unnamed protein product [Trichogramma brassicae]|uniref:VWFC domain-containing protein n=1 Tax=Trichogramma brassicae TaxID=86971 RepID=A0A6H5ILY2_9HYME|nr:unnamed protein product [Trichogramma brassicae]